jgi:uncharacterized repeat protein (TIGR01451 family)
MHFLRTSFILTVALVGTLLAAQEPGSGPPGEYKRMPSRRVFDPDADDDIRQADHTVPSPLPGELLTTPTVIPAQYTETAGSLSTPIVTLNIEGSEAVSINQPVTYKLRVQNTSRARAHNVVVKVTPPAGATKISAVPPATTDGQWVWKTLEGGQVRIIELAYQPAKTATEFRLEARVQFDFGRGLVTQLTAPALAVKAEGSPTMVIGDTERRRIRIENTGKVTIKDIKVHETLGKDLVYEEREASRGMVDGRLTSSVNDQRTERTWSLPSLLPGRSEVLEYQVKARQAGQCASTILVDATDVKEKAEFQTEVLSAQLQLQAVGPTDGKGTVGQKAAYRITVANRGTVDLRNVVVRCQFPSDMKPARATSGGQSFRESVQWIFKELRIGDVEELDVFLTTTSPGTRTVHFSARAEKGKEQKTLVTTDFAGVPSLDWNVDSPGVGAIGKSITYRVTVSNRGSAEGRARLQVDLPPALDFKSSIPQAGQGHGQNAKEVRFPEYTFPAGKKTTFTVVVAPKEAGEAKTIFTLFEPGRPEKHQDGLTNITGTDSHSPAGPPPARGVDPSKVGFGPRP